MKLGLFSMPLHPPGRLHADTYDEDLKLMALADQLGYSEAWIGEHFTTAWENMPSPDLFIARALGVTERLVMGTGVALLPFHDPIMVAHRIAMLDHLARSRLFFGIGSGGVPTDFEMFGMDIKSGAQRRRMRESIEVILKLWTEERPFEHQGEHFQARLPEPRPVMGLAFHMRPYQQPHPPIAVAGSSRTSETLELAGERGWWPMSSSFLHSSMLGDHWEAVERGAARTGRAVSRREWRIAREVYVADDSHQAREDALNGPLGKSFSDYFRPLIGMGMRGYDAFKYDLETPDGAITPEYMMENFWIVGDPQECAQKIRKLYQDVGGFGTLLLICHDWGREQEKWHHSLDLMATEVLPALEDLPISVA